MASWNDSLQALQHEFDISVWGHDLVGKSSLILYYIYNRFQQDIDFSVEDLYSKVIPYGRTFRNIKILDTKGYVDTYSTARRQQIMNTKSIVFAYSIADRVSYEAVEDYFESVSNVRKRAFPFVVVGLKSDLEDRREVSHVEGEELAKKLGAIKFVECSAKYGTNIKDVFDPLISNISRRVSDTSALSQIPRFPGVQKPRSSSFSSYDHVDATDVRTDTRPQNAKRKPAKTTRSPHNSQESSRTKAKAQTASRWSHVSANSDRSPRTSGQHKTERRSSNQNGTSHHVRHQGNTQRRTHSDKKQDRTRSKARTTHKSACCTIM